MDKYKEILEQSQRKSIWQAALYIRLSKEDGDKQESYSVTSQREILKEYLKQHSDIALLIFILMTAGAVQILTDRAFSG